MKLRRLLIFTLLIFANMHGNEDSIPTHEQQDGFWKKRLYNEKFLIRQKKTDGSTLVWDRRKMTILCTLGALKFTSFISSYSSNKILFDFIIPLSIPPIAHRYLSYYDQETADDDALIFKDLETLARYFLLAMYTFEVATQTYTHTKKSEQAFPSLGTTISNAHTSLLNDKWFKMTVSARNLLSYTLPLTHYLLSSAYTGNILPWSYEKPDQIEQETTSEDRDIVL